MNHEPTDGDFASYVEHLARDPSFPTAEPPPAQSPPSHQPLPISAQPFLQTIEAAAFSKKEPSEEILEELRALAAAPELSEDELVRQALADPGADEDNGTPE